ncbi:NUDIX hydrolase [Micromonospora sp. NPDC050417]|uniref:NUDIX hydrolase n=1 Tax=Micromonospora sp. NPDC050417 TaxID=3364280 RepID=UPI0037B5B490
MTIDSGGFAAPEPLVEHARRFYATGAVPATPRVAATVLLLRPEPTTTRPDPGLPAPSGAVTVDGRPAVAGADFEVYVIRRLAAMTFGGMYAFPGGGVDPSDSRVPLDWSGPSADSWGDRLGLAPQAAQAVLCAAAREVFEEAGVLLAGPGPGTIVGDVSGDDWEAARQALVERRISFADLLRERRLTLRADLLLPWARWITPEFEPRRFDTYFFVALLPRGQRTRDVSGEADHTMWIRPTDAVTRADAGEIAMLPPTRVTLTEVAACGALAGVPAAASARDVATPVLPRLELAPDGTGRFLLR